MSKFLDYLGNPISVGDLVVYPTVAGRSSSQQTMGIVEVVDPLVQDLNGQYCYESMKKKANHATFPFPTTAYRNPKTKKWDSVPAPHKAFGLKVRKLYEGSTRFGVNGWDNPNRLFTVRNVTNVIVVTKLNNRPVHPIV